MNGYISGGLLLDPETLEALCCETQSYLFVAESTNLFPAYRSTWKDELFFLHQAKINIASLKPVAYTSSN